MQHLLLSDNDFIIQLYFSLSLYLQFNDTKSKFIKRGSTVFHLGIDKDYALKYDTTKEDYVIVEKYVDGDKDFVFIFRHPPGIALE